MKPSMKKIMDEPWMNKIIDVKASILEYSQMAPQRFLINEQKGEAIGSIGSSQDTRPVRKESQSSLNKHPHHDT